VNYRIKYEAPDSLLSEDEGMVVYDYVTVRYHHKCADLVIAIDDMPDVTYYVKSTSTVPDTYQPTITLTNDDSCSLETEYKIRQ
jgi:hypothetical protein